MGAPKLDREKYLKIARTEGLDKALTALHHEMISIEWDSFEGIEGYKPEQWEGITAWRDFSEELWSMRHEIKNSWDPADAPFPSGTPASSAARDRR